MLKASYYIIYVISVLQLLVWLFGPFLGPTAIYDAIKEADFYNRNVQEQLNLSNNSFVFFSKILSLIYFIGLIIVVSSLLFRKRKNLFILMTLLGMMSLFILLLSPVLRLIS